MYVECWSACSGAVNQCKKEYKIERTQSHLAARLLVRGSRVLSPIDFSRKRRPRWVGRNKPAPDDPRPRSLVTTTAEPEHWQALFHPGPSLLPPEREHPQPPCSNHSTCLSSLSLSLSRPSPTRSKTSPPPAPPRPSELVSFPSRSARGASGSRSNWSK